MRDDKYWDICNDESIRQKVAEFIDNSPLLSKFKGEKYYELEDAIVALIEQNKDSIHATVERENKVYEEFLSEENAKYIDGEAGVCPFCKSEELEYGQVAEHGDVVDVTPYQELSNLKIEVLKDYFRRQLL